MELNSSELNSVPLNSPPPGDALPSGEQHLILNLSCELSFFTTLETPIVNLDYNYFVPTTVEDENLLSVRYDYFVATIVQHKHLLLDYEYYVATTSYCNRLQFFQTMGQVRINFARALLHITTDFTPYDVAVGYHVGAFYDLNGVRTQYIDAYPVFRYTALRSTEVAYALNLAFGMGMIQDGEHEFSLEYWVYNFDPVPFQFAYDMGLNVLVDSHDRVSIANGMGVLTSVSANGLPTIDYDMGVLTESHGAKVSLAYSMPSLTDARMEFPIDYWVRSIDQIDVGLYWAMDYGSANMGFTLSSEKYNTADLAFGIFTDITYNSGLAMLGVAYGVERKLRVGIDIPAGFTAFSKVVINSVLRAYARSGLVVHPSLLDKPRKGVDLVSSLGYARSGVDILPSLPKTPRRGLSVSLPFRAHCLSGMVVPLYLYEACRAGIWVGAPLSARDYISRKIWISSPLTDDTPHIRGGSYYLVVGGVHVEIQKGTVRADEADYAWHGTFTLTNPRQLSLFTVNAEFTIELPGDTYTFVVESKSNKRTSPATMEATVVGISPSAVLDSPRALQVTKNWETNTTARAIVEEMAGTHPVLWEIIDWAIPGGRYGVSLVSPISVIQEIATAVGGTVDSLYDGTLRVRFKYPDTVPAYGPLTKEHTYIESEHLFEFTEDYAPVREYDKFRITDMDTNTENDVLDYEEVTASTGIMRVYPGPWRDTFVLKSTAIVYIGPRDYEVREETEVIEITKGEGSTRFPVYSVISVEWIDDNLLGVVAGDDSRKITTTHPDKKYSIVKLKYNTRCFKYPIVGTLGRYAQFIVENP